MIASLPLGGARMAKRPRALARLLMPSFPGLFAARFSIGRRYKGRQPTSWGMGLGCWLKSWMTAIGDETTSLLVERRDQQKRTPSSIISART